MADANVENAERAALSQVSTHGHSSNWASVLTAYRSARLAEAAFDREVWMPQFTAGGAHGLTVETQQEMQRLTLIRERAEHLLVNEPAPDLAAFAIKVLVATREGGDWGLWKETLRHEAIDVARFSLCNIGGIAE